MSRARTYSVHFLKICHGVGRRVAILGTTELMFIEPGVKINGAYYRDVLLDQHLLPAIRSVTGDFFTYNAPAHRAGDTVEFCLAIHQILSYLCRGRPIALT